MRRSIKNRYKIMSFNIFKYKMTLNFLAFGSHANYIEAGKRLLNQAKSLDLFDKLDLYNSDDLKKNKDFWDIHGTFIENNAKGGG